MTTTTIYSLHAQLSKDYISFYENENKYTDVLIRVGRDENFKDFNVHSFVLLVRSNYFRKKIEEIKEKSDDGKFVIEMPDINSKLFDQILRYFYGGNLKYNSDEIFDYLLITKEFDIAELLGLLQDQLLKSPNQIYQKFSTTLQISSSHESFKKLYEFCLKTIQEYPKIIFKSKDFHLLKEDILLILLKNKELDLKEVEKWESIIKWGNYQAFTNTSSSTNTCDENFDEMPDVSLWTKVKFRDLANTLKQFIPLVNIYKISPEDFYKKVKPFKKIVGKQLYEEILQHHLFSKNDQSNPQPSTSASAFTIKPEPLINSVLTDLDHFRLITRWISNDSSNRYRLLLRGSRDGFTAKKFHELCDNKGATLSIIKVNGSDEIIGGYNPISWNTSLNPVTKNYNEGESFVFKLDNRNINNSIMGRPRNTHNPTLGNMLGDGPIFVGALYIKGGLYGDFKKDVQSVCRGETYGISLRNSRNEFSVDEYEVYQVIQKSI